MRAVCRLLPLAFLVLAAQGAVAEEVAGLPLHVQRLDPKTVRVWVGDHVSTTNVVAFATAKGIVVVDTTGIPKVDRELRKVIARELGRSDFAALINTHEHGDHTGANAVYADVPIVAHERCAAGMQRDPANRTRVLEWQATHIAELERDLAKLPAGSPEALKKSEQLVFARLNREVMQADEKPVLPTKTFADRMTLDMGDTAFELSYIGGMHSASDIAVFVPSRGILMTGDTMADKWLNDTPGCLAAFIARENVVHDFPLLLENGRRLLAQKDRIRTLLPGHWNAELSFAGFEARLGYVEDALGRHPPGLEGGEKGSPRPRRRTASTSASPASRRAPASTRATTRPRSPRCGRSSRTSVPRRRSSTTSSTPGGRTTRSAASSPSETRRRRGTSSSRARSTAGGTPSCRGGKTEKAVALFRINTELFPGSWNVWDSYGEALLKSGDVDGAKRMYEKSVALNPENKNGKEALARLRSEGATK